jgi:hypothetical protein
VIFPRSCCGDVGAATTINAYEGGTVLVRAIDGAMTGLAFLDRDLCDVEHAGRCHQADHERAVERGRQGDGDDPAGGDWMLDSPDQTIIAGRAAWERIRDHGRMVWGDWLLIGRALFIGRIVALKAADTNRCVGSKYNAAMAAWLRENGLDDVVAQERYQLFLILENLTEIEAWRAGLDDVQRRRLNHPNAIWAHWRRQTDGKRAAPALQHFLKSAMPSHRNGRPVHWPQSFLRRGAEAYRECRSNDVFIIVRAILERAIRSESDVIELLSRTLPRCPLFPRERTSSAWLVMSVKCRFCCKSLFGVTTENYQDRWCVSRAGI